VCGLYMIELGCTDLLGDGVFLCHNVGLRLCSCCFFLEMVFFFVTTWD
jgi:hypothetical protein